MKLNHLHVCVPDVKTARTFYEQHFGFVFAFEEYDGKMIFLRDDGDFLLALHELKAGDQVAFPPWFHFGFRVESQAKVLSMYAALEAAGVQIESKLKEGDGWATFRCWAPGPYKLEVSWDRVD
jgi:catechol 2,3-dioxygenase-like lactoylglutathione lyase family enzyme